jgi:hypothetical protein
MPNSLSNGGGVKNSRCQDDVEPERHGMEGDDQQQPSFERRYRLEYFGAIVERDQGRQHAEAEQPGDDGRQAA